MTRFHGVGAELGATFGWVSLAGVTQGDSAQPYVDKWERLLAESDVYVISGRNLPDTGTNLARIRDAIRGGKGALFLIDPKCLNIVNPLLAHFDMAATLLVIANADLWADQNSLRLRREDECMRDLSLFARVAEVTITVPQVIWYSRSAVPLLVATGSQMVVDEGDHCTSHDARQCACMVGWSGAQDQRVIAVSGAMFEDPMSRLPLTGIEVNEQFARNLIGMFRADSLHSSVQTLNPDQYCDRIEINLCEFVLTVLKQTCSSDDWWTECIPLTIRQKCANRKEEEGNKYPPEAYFDLTDLEAIISNRWQTFEAMFRQVQAPPKKADALGWIKEVNSKYRRMAAHPLKRRIAGFQFSTEDLKQLQKWDDFTQRLIGLVSPPVAPGTVHSRPS